MKLLMTLYEEGANPAMPRQHFRYRKSARAVVTDRDGRVALLHVAKNKYHKLPGGGIEEGEDAETALKREMLEEIGCDTTGITELGELIEHRDAWQLTQSSYFYCATQTGEHRAPAFTPEELADGFEVVWAGSIPEAIALLTADVPQGYEGPMIQKRDIAILKVAERHLSGSISKEV